MALDLEVHKKSVDSKFLVVFIHGLGAPDTWIEANWIETLLKDDTLTGIDVGVVRYDTAHLTSGVFSISGTFRFLGKAVTIEKVAFQAYLI